MGSNAEIRQRMDTYRGVLLVINWIGSIVGIIVGFVLFSVLEGYAAIIIIVAIIFGIIGHFLINVALAIPFILLNNGDILESMKKNQVTQENIVTQENSNSDLSHSRPENNTSNEVKSENIIENSTNNEDSIFIDESVNMGQYKSKLKFYVRESPSLSSKELFSVEKDEVLTVIACGDKVPDNSLGYVKNKNGKKGWCYFNNLTKI